MKPKNKPTEWVPAIMVVGLIAMAVGLIVAGKILGWECMVWPWGEM